MPVKQAADPVAAFFRGASGLAPPRLPRMVTLMDQLLTVPKEKEDLLGDVAEPDLVPLPASVWRR